MVVPDFRNLNDRVQTSADQGVAISATRVFRRTEPLPFWKVGHRIFWFGGTNRLTAAQYSSPNMTVITRVVTAGSAGSGEWYSMARS